MAGRAQPDGRGAAQEKGTAHRRYGEGEDRERRDRQHVGGEERGGERTAAAELESRQADGCGCMKETL